MIDKIISKTISEQVRDRFQGLADIVVGLRSLALIYYQ
jgi:hypothetical protein